MLLATLPFACFAPEGSATSGYADIPLAFLTLGAVLAGTRGRSLEAALWAVGMILTKREGQPLALLVLLLIFRQDRRWVPGGLTLLLSLPWLLCRHFGVEEVESSQIILDRVIPPNFLALGGYNLVRIIGEMLWPGNWSLLWWLVPVACWGGRWTRAERFLGQFLLGYGLLLLVLFLPLKEEVYKWILVNRTLIPLTGPAVLLVGYRLRAGSPPPGQNLP